MLVADDPADDHPVCRTSGEGLTKTCGFSDDALSTPAEPKLRRTNFPWKGSFRNYLVVTEIRRLYSFRKS